MEYLVGVGITDSAEESGIGERSLEGMVLLNQPLGELGETGFQNLQAATRELPESLLSAHEPKRSTALGAGFGKNECPVREVERGEADFTRNFRSGRHPAQTAGNHEMNHQEQIVLQLEHDSLSHPSHSNDALSVGGAHRRIHRAEKKRLGD